CLGSKLQGTCQELLALRRISDGRHHTHRKGEFFDFFTCCRNRNLIDGCTRDYQYPFFNPSKQYFVTIRREGDWSSWKNVWLKKNLDAGNWIVSRKQQAVRPKQPEH